MTLPAQWVRGLEERAVQQLGLRQRELAAEHANHAGTWRDRPVTLSCRAYDSSGVAFARVVELSGHGLEIHNLLFVPRPERDAPLLGVDLVSVGRPERVVVADASWRSGGEHAATSSLPSAGPLPSWCQRFFSPTPVFARVTDDAFAQAVPELDARFSLFAAAVTASRGSESGQREWLQSYLDAHRNEDRGLLLMAKMFGEAWTERFLEEVLFPVKCPGV